MSERSCSIPVVVRLRGVPDEGRLADMSETIARTVAGRLSEAASIISGREGWNSYRATHTPPVVRFIGGSLDTTLQRRVAAAIEAGIARAVSSRSGAVTGSAPAARPVRSTYPAAAPAAGLRLDSQETETGWYLNGILIFKIQRPGSGAKDRLDFQPLLSINGDGSTKLQITVFRDANVTVLLQPDAVSQLTQLASEIVIRDVVTVAPPEPRPLALRTVVAGPTSQPTAVPERSEPAPPPATEEELQRPIDIPLPPSPAAFRYPRSGAPPPLSSSDLDSAKIESLPLPRPGADQSIDFRTTARSDLDEQRYWTDLPSRDSRGGTGARPQSSGAPSSSERYEYSAAVVKAATDDQLRQLTGTPEGRRLLEQLFDEFTTGETSEEARKQADRILVLKTKALMAEEEFTARVEPARGDCGIILPYKKTGSMGSEASPIYVSRLPASKVRVQLRQDIFTTRYAFDPDVRLPPSISQGVELNEMDVVGVKFLDEGGVVSFFPALFLMQLEIEATRVAPAKIGEALSVGPTTGIATEAAAAEGAEAIETGGLADAARGTGLAWADRVALGLDLASFRIQKHRGWIIETWPDKGRAFVSSMEQLTAYARIYGLVDGGSGLVHFGDSLQKGYQDWRATANAVNARLSEEDRESIEQIGKDTEELLQALKDAEQAALPAPSDVLAVEELKAPFEKPGIKSEPTKPAGRQESRVLDP